MRCPKCGHLDDKVIDSRTVRDGDVIRRRRKCLGCEHRFTTYEEVVKAHMRVVKRDECLEELSRAKLRNGLEKACEKRPVSTKQIDQVVDELVTEIEAEFEREVPSTVIGEKMMSKLEQLDEIAYVRFASVYRRFRDVNQFLSEVESLIGRD